MEITASTIYWITRLDALEGLFILFATVGTLVSAIAAAITIVEEGDDEVQRIVKRVLKFSVPALVIGFLGCFFVPNTEQAATMWVVPKIVNGESLSAVGTNVLHLIDINLDNLKGH